MKNRVGIITYHASHNIGSMLQTYAMQYVLQEKYDCDVEIIDFSSDAQRNMYSLFPKIRSFKGLVRVIINTITYPILKARFKDFELFKSEHFNLTENSFCQTNQLKKVFNNYTHLIAGSDQIWNVNCEDYDEAYFLPFDTVAKKIAYAPSLGGKNILESNVDLDKYKSFVNDFDALSIREVNGCNWLEKLSGSSFSIVADPTILTTTEVWDPLVNDPEIEEDYIFFYGVPFSPETYDKVCEISEKLNLPVVMLDAKSWIYRGNFMKGIKLHSHSSPSDYLGLIKNAKLVITTSFHGSIFATIFRKNFWAVTFKETNPNDDRIKTLFTQLNLEDRLIYIEDYEDYELLEDVNYESYDGNIEKFRERSFSFLSDALEK